MDTFRFSNCAFLHFFTINNNRQQQQKKEKEEKEWKFFNFFSSHHPQCKYEVFDVDELLKVSFIIKLSSEICKINQFEIN